MEYSEEQLKELIKKCSGLVRDSATAFAQDLISRPGCNDVAVVVAIDIGGSIISTSLSSPGLEDLLGKLTKTLSEECLNTKNMAPVYDETGSTFVQIGKETNEEFN